MTRAADWLGAQNSWVRCLIAFAAGCAVTAALPPIYALPLLFIAFPVFALLIDTCTHMRRVIGLGWLFGAGHMLTGLYWVGNALEIAGAPPVLAISLPLAMAFYPAVAASLYWVTSRQLARLNWAMSDGFVRAALVALCWLIGEWLRGHLFTGFPWNLIGYSWAFSDTMSQAAALMGAYGLSFLVAFIACLPLAITGRSWRSAGVWVPIVAGLVLVCGQYAYGLQRLADGAPTATDVMVRIVQANISQEDKWRPELRAKNFNQHLEMSEQEGSDKVDLLIWPEVAVIYFLAEDPIRTTMMGRRVKPEGMVLTGSLRRAAGPDRTIDYFNSFMAIDSGGEVRDHYDKSHLVPFGEYVPLKFLFQALGIEKLVEGAGDYSAGSGPRIVSLAGLPSVTPLICYEVIFPGQVLPKGERPGLMLNVTNDAWYGITTGPYQHLMISRFRAIEEGLPMLRAASTGISAIIDAKGRLLQSLDLGTQGIIDGQLPARLEQGTLFGKFGNTIVIALVLVVFMLAGMMDLAKRLRMRKDQSAA